jgi:hypothetical protein
VQSHLLRSFETYGKAQFATAHGGIRLSRLHFRTTRLVENRKAVHGRPPLKESLQRLRTSVHELLHPQENGPWEQVRIRLNSLSRGWQKYFSYGSVARMYASLNRHVYDRVRHFLRRRHKITHSRGTRQFSLEFVFGELGVHALRPVR